MSAADQLALAKSINHPVRKLAHFTEYLVLGMLAINAIRLLMGSSGRDFEDEATTPSRNFYIPVLSWVFCILYAASDEFHQLFVPGRAGLVTDVCIDSAGALLGILLFLAALHLTSRRAKRK